MSGVGARFRAVAHRGASAEAPENTIPAFELALELGADALELDVRRTRDGELVVIHDPTLERTTDRAGQVADSVAAFVVGAQAAPNVHIPRLRDVFARFPGIEMTVDVKDPGAAADVVALIHEFGRVRATILYVEEGTGTEAFRTYPGRRATSSRQAARLARFPVGGARALGRRVPEVVHTPLRQGGATIVTPRFVARMRRSGRSVQVWTVDDAALMARLAGWGVDRIVTNDVRAAAALRGPAKVAGERR